MICTKCSQEKPEDAFYLRSHKTGRRRRHCKECDNARNLSRYHSDPAVKAGHHKASRKHLLMSRYGLSVEAYEQMKFERANRCDICSGPEKQNRDLAVDHCHSTGKVRGLLCMACNTAIGKLREDPALIRAAADYVARHA